MGRTTDFFGFMPGFMPVHAWRATHKSSPGLPRGPLTFGWETAARPPVTNWLLTPSTLSLGGNVGITTAQRLAWRKLGESQDARTVITPRGLRDYLQMARVCFLTCLLI